MLAFVSLILALQTFGSGSGHLRQSSFVFYPAAPHTARYQFLTRIYSSDDVSKPSMFSRLVLGDQPSQRFGKPYGVTVVGPRIFVADTPLNLIVRIDLETKEMTALSSAGSVRFDKLINLDRDSSGNIYATDVGARRIYQMSQDGDLLRTYGEDTEISPIDVAVGESVIYVVDRETHDVYLLDRGDGSVVGTFDVSADSLGWIAPTNIAVAPGGDVYVVDTVSCRILQFDSEGNFIQSYGAQGYHPGFFARPKGIAIDPDGNLLVVDAAFENVQILRSEDARPLTFLGGPGQASGNMWLPAGIAVAPELPRMLSEHTHPGVELAYGVVVTSQFGPPHIDIYGKISNVYGFARTYPPDEQRDAAAPGLMPPDERPPDVTGADLN